MARKRTQPPPSGLRDRIIELRRVVASEIVSHPSNWRTHPPAQLAALEGILGEVGIADSLLGFPADGKGIVTKDCPLMVFDGHARKDRDPSQVWPVLVMDLTRAEADKMLAVIDPLAAMAEPDEAARQALWDSLVLESQALKAMAPAVTAPEIIEDDVPEPPANPITKLGDLWLLGEHRLLCGDSTKAGDIGRVMGDKLADVVFTDPPYDLETSQGNKGCFQKSYRKVTSKALQNISNSFDIAAAFTSWKAICRGSAFVFCSNRQVPQIMIEAARVGLSPTILIWHKYNSVPFSHGTWRQDVEFVIHCHKSGAALNGDADKKSKVRRMPFDASVEGHTTVKPIALVADYLGIGTNKGDLIFDQYLGSGTTLVAAEQLGRKCYGLEISPAYCDVIVKRWENLTGLKATLERQPSAKTPAAKKRKAS